MVSPDLNLLLNLLRIPSVSTLPEHRPDMAICRNYLVQLFKSLGFTTRILPGVTHPAVFASLATDPRLPTILIYGHYDVQPPEPLDQWTTPPFEPTIKKDILYARGATDNKGQFMTHVMAVKNLASHPPVNFKFLLEGEEEIGSPSISGIAAKYPRLLQADYLIVSDSEMPHPGQPAIDISLRGLLYTEIRLTTAAHDAHSGVFGGVIPNPANLLADLIAKLKDDSGRILIPSFYDNVVKLSPQELADFAKLEPKTQDILAESSAFSLGGGESDRTLNQRRWSRPTLDVNGLSSGFTGEGSKTIIPARAMAKVSMRLVPDQNPDAIFRKFAAYVTSLLPPKVKLEIIRHSDCLPYKAPTNHPVFSLAKTCLKNAFGKTPVFYASGGSIGAIPLLTEALGNIPCLMIGLGNADDNLHAPNEHIRISNITTSITALTDFYNRLPSLHRSLS